MRGDAGGSWPVVGRVGLVDRLAEALLNGAGDAALLVGAAGVGKTTLARALCDAAEQQGRVVLRCIGSSSAATIPFGAVAGLLPDGPPGPDPLALLTAVRARLTTDHERPPVLWVDDAHLLDAGSATLVQQLATAGACRLVATMRTGEPAPDALAALWRSGDAEVVEVSPLTLEEVDELLAGVLGPPVTRGAVRGLWQRTGGNPLLLRELVTASLADGSLSRAAGAWTVRDDSAEVARLPELVGARLGELGPDDRHLAELLALAETLDVDDAERLVPGCDLDSLQERGVLVDADDAGRVRLVHPVYGEVLRGALPAGRRRRRYRELADGLADSGHADPLRRATWLLEAGTQPTPDLLVAAAAQARNRFDLPLAERLAQAAVEAGAGVPGALVLADVLARRGRHDAALAALSAAAERAEVEDEIADIADRQAWVLELAGQRDRAWDVLRAAADRVSPQRRALLDSQAAILGVLSGRPVATLAVIDDLLASQDGDRDALPMLARIRVDYAETFALALRGRLADAEERSAAAAAVLDSLGQGHYPAEMALLGRVVARLLAGQLNEAAADARRVEAAALALGDRDAEWTAALFHARVGLARGEVDVRHADAALALARELGDAAGQRWCQGARLLALSWRGAAAEARVVAADLDESAPDGLFEADLVRRGLAWAHLAAGRPTEARRVLAAAVDLAADLGQSAVEIWLRHDLLRMGDREQVGPLVELAARVEGPGPAAIAGHAEAVRADDGAALLAAADALAACGAVVPAAEAALAAVPAFRRAGDARGATRAERRAGELRASCPDVRLPTLVTEVSTPTPLTAREREIAELAARRLSAAEIAERLVLSRRTVENHLQRIYTKLGISGRAELAAALRR